MTTLPELISLCERAEGPSYELDRRITEVTGYPNIYRMPNGLIPENATFPAFTASVDAAIALADKVLPGTELDITRRDDGTGYACVWPSVGFRSRNAATPAIALVLATLKALEAKGQ